MDQDLKNKIDSLLNKTPKKTSEEIKEMLINTQAFITLDKIQSLIHEKKESLKIYNELKQKLPEFYLITYKEHLIKCGLSSELDETEITFYCKALDETFMLSKNKIHYSLLNLDEKFIEKVQSQVKAIEDQCNKNN